LIIVYVITLAVGPIVTWSGSRIEAINREDGAPLT